MVYGAAGAGARVMTSSSSPGISLKQEGISYIAAAELPSVVVNIMRGGPGLGGIQPGQADYFQATKGGGHGDYHSIVANMVALGALLAAADVVKAEILLAAFSKKFAAKPGIVKANEEAFQQGYDFVAHGKNAY